MNKFYTLSVSTKGQVTIPVELRRLLNLNKQGDRLRLKVSDDGEIGIMKPSNIDDLHKYLAPKIKNKKPLQDTKEFYQTRKPRL